MPKRDDPTTLELGALERLRGLPDFQVFLTLVQGHGEAVTLALARPAITPEDVALHNVNIGRLWAYQTVLRLVDARTARAEITEALNETRKTLRNLDK